MQLVRETVIENAYIHLNKLIPYHCISDCRPWRHWRDYSEALQFTTFLCISSCSRESKKLESFPELLKTNPTKLKKKLHSWNKNKHLKLQQYSVFPSLFQMIALILLNFSWSSAVGAALGPRCIPSVRAEGLLETDGFTQFCTCVEGALPRRVFIYFILKSASRKTAQLQIVATLQIYWWICFFLPVLQRLHCYAVIRHSNRASWQQKITSPLDSRIKLIKITCFLSSSSALFITSN